MVFGFFWAFVEPLFTVLIYWFINHFVFGNNRFGNLPYIVWLLAGMVPWFFVLDSWINVSRVFWDYSYLVKKIVFDVTCLPFIRIISCLFVNLIFTFLIFLICFIYKIPFKFIYFQVFYYIFASFFLVVGIGLIICSLSVFLKDISNIVRMLLQFVFWLTPIFWDVNSISKFNWLFKINPVYYIVQGYRNTFIYGIWFFEDLSYFFYFWFFAAFVLVFGKILFNKTTVFLVDSL
jgi:lipopolysaccharide transport system permease protein/teichoic acid transport system permease protein